MKKLNKKGFTLVELIVVIAIIGILAAVLVPSVTSYIGKAQKSAADQAAGNKITEFTNAYTMCVQGNASTYLDDATLASDDTTKLSANYAGYYYVSGAYICVIKVTDGAITLDSSKKAKLASDAADLTYNSPVKGGTTEELTVKVYNDGTDNYVPLPEDNDTYKSIFSCTAE